jgi:hypothetical protein
MYSQYTERPVVLMDQSIRIADAYIKALAGNGRLVSRSSKDHEKIFEQAGLSIECQASGNILVIIGNK